MLWIRTVSPGAIARCSPRPGAPPLVLKWRRPRRGGPRRHRSGRIAAAPAPGPRARADSAPAGLPLHASRPTSPPERQQKLELEKEHGSARHWQARRYPQGLVRLIQEQLQRPRPLVPAALGHAPPPKHLPKNGALYCLRCTPGHIRMWCSMRSEGEHALVPGSCLQPQMR